MAKKKVKVVTPIKAVVEELPPEVPAEARVLSQIERIAKMGTDYSKMFDQETAKGLFSRYSVFSLQELQSILKNNPNLSALERSTINLIAKAMGNGKDFLAAKSYLDDRIFGKVATKTEVTGARGGPIQLEAETKLQLERKLSVMSEDDIEAVEENLLRIRGLIGNNGSPEVK